MSRNLPTWFWGWSAAVLAAAALPYLLAWALAPNGYQFTGMLANPQDGYSYVAKIRLAAEGGWSGQIPYAVQPHGDAPVYPQYVLLGKVSAVTGAPPVLVYHGARITAAAFLLAMTLLLLNQLIKKRRGAQDRVHLCCGWGWPHLAHRALWRAGIRRYYPRVDDLRQQLR